MKKLICSICGKPRKLGQRKCLACSVKQFNKRQREQARKIKKREKKENSITKLKDKAWELCSKYNRMKDANLDGFVQCCTCSKIDHWKKLQAGHFVPGRGNGVLFDDRGIHAQCYQCNCPKKGQWVEYEKFMLERYGQDVINEIKANKYKVKLFTPDELKMIIEDYKIKINNLSTVIA